MRHREGCSELLHTVAPDRGECAQLVTHHCIGRCVCFSGRGLYSVQLVMDLSAKENSTCRVSRHPEGVMEVEGVLRHAADSI